MFYSFAIQNKDGRNKIEFGITKFPDRKRYCLYKKVGSMIYPLAYFKSDKVAEETNEILQILYKATK